MGMDLHGKRIYHNQTFHGTKKEAEKQRTALLHQRDTGNLRKTSKETLSQYISKWLEEIASKRVAPRTYQDYKSYMEHHVYPLLGDVLLSQLRPLDVQLLINQLTEKGYIRLARYVHSILRQALEQAVKWEMISRNPARNVSVPRQKHEEQHVLSHDEMRKFLNAALYDPYYPLFVLLLATGMRPGEAFGLQWNDIDLEHNRIAVQRSLDRTGGKWSLKAPKTAQSRRSIPIPNEVSQILIQHGLTQSERKKKFGDNYQDFGFVFTAENGQPIYKQNFVRRHFKPILIKAGLSTELRLYDLRHTCATLLLGEGIHPKIVSERLGYASVNMTLNRYSHVLPDMQQTATNAMGEVMFGKDMTEE
jgi:integrase